VELAGGTAWERSDSQFGYTLLMWAVQNDDLPSLAILLDGMRPC
jgi:hypothetical protein